MAELRLGHAPRHVRSAIETRQSTQQPKKLLPSPEKPEKPERKNSSYELLWFSLSDKFLSQAAHRPYTRQILFHNNTLDDTSDE